MPLDRRHFLSGTAATAGALSLAGRLAAAEKASWSDAANFGPPHGIAQLNRNENPYGPAPEALRAIADTAGQGCYYADRSLDRLAAMIAERHRVSARQVVLGEGSTEILSAIALAWGRKGSILCPGLFWDTTVQYGERLGATVVRVPLAPHMGVDLDAMAAAVEERTALVHVCNPNNPTGMLTDAADMRAFAARVTPQATLLVDEAYNELTDDPAANSMVDLVRAGEDVIVCRTFSKIYGMAGMRVGYAITSELNAERIRNCLMSFGGNSAGLAAAIASYDDKAFLYHSLSRIREGREMILAAVAASGLRALPSQTNFVYVEVPDAEAVRAAMAARGIHIRGAYGKWTRHSRVSTGYIEDVRRYADALPQVIDGLRT
ncbi:histidinol-phosphate aminotransferase [Novosphingobium marinum]|uniref:Histidinol-phosphate aminotransferase n=1 Tax=Novosphingobium marinum TaxID=1514948 RepID=A0A7Y9XZL6_9SPHN|nr:histidinol-phosphate transaminase [Novosphingobium marinum]NYH96225.1 histidinol-phosphate aminotransferase [Novosphingobium marinum]GGC33473.1 histidinol-phosphate aminotransferase [Novosphingobium marinum]